MKKPISRIKLASTIVSITEYSIRAILIIVILFIGKRINVYGEIRYVQFSALECTALLTINVVGLAILIWRQLSIYSGKKTAVGILTLLYVSVVGGILTLLIPDYDLWN